MEGICLALWRQDVVPVNRDSLLTHKKMPVVASGSPHDEPRGNLIAYYRD
jgi:hypothetical protein